MEDTARAAAATATAAALLKITALEGQTSELKRRLEGTEAALRQTRRRKSRGILSQIRAKIANYYVDAVRPLDPPVSIPRPPAVWDSLGVLGANVLLSSDPRAITMSQSTSTAQIKAAFPNSELISASSTTEEQRIVLIFEPVIRELLSDVKDDPDVEKLLITLLLVIEPLVDTGMTAKLYNGSGQDYARALGLPEDHDFCELAYGTCEGWVSNAVHFVDMAFSNVYGTVGCIAPPATGKFVIMSPNNAAQRKMKNIGRIPTWHTTVSTKDVVFVCDESCAAPQLVALDRDTMALWPAVPALAKRPCVPMCGREFTTPLIPEMSQLCSVVCELYDQGVLRHRNLHEALAAAGYDGDTPEERTPANRERLQAFRMHYDNGDVRPVDLANVLHVMSIKVEKGRGKQDNTFKYRTFEPAAKPASLTARYNTDGMYFHQIATAVLNTDPAFDDKAIAWLFDAMQSFPHPLRDGAGQPVINFYGENTGVRLLTTDGQKQMKSRGEKLQITIKKK